MLIGACFSICSVHDSKMSISQNPSPMLESKFFSNKEEHEKLNCCEECVSNYEKEAQLFKPDQKNLLPSWLQSHSTEARQKVAKFYLFSQLVQEYKTLKNLIPKKIYLI